MTTKTFIQRIARTVADFIDSDDFLVRLALAFAFCLCGFALLCLLMGLMFDLG